MKKLILALDIATRAGFAIGRPGAIPRSGTLVLKRPGEPREVAYSNFLFWLWDRLSTERPALIVKEAPFHLGAFAKKSNSEANVVLSYGLHAIVEGIAHRHSIRCENVPANTVRKHFIGRADLGKRVKTKQGVISRCHLLGLMPEDCKDDNRADALAVFDYAAATFGRVIPGELMMFGEEVANAV